MQPFTEAAFRRPNSLWSSLQKASPMPRMYSGGRAGVMTDTERIAEAAQVYDAIEGQSDVCSVGNAFASFAGGHGFATVAAGQLAIPGAKLRAALDRDERVAVALCRAPACAARRPARTAGSRKGSRR